MSGNNESNLLCLKKYPREDMTKIVRDEVWLVEE